MGGDGFLRKVGQTGQAGIGLAAAVAIAVLAVATGFLDPVSLLITVGGALGVTRATFSRERLASARRHLAAALGDEPSPEETVAVFKRLGRVHRTEGAPALEEEARRESDPLVRRGIILALECRDAEELADILLVEARQRAADGEAARHVLVTLGRLFPAFGLIGTLIGLVLLLRHLAQPSLTSIGPGLGIAVLTTLYGAVFANVVILPLSTKLHAHLARQALRAQMVIDGVLLVHRQEYPTRIERVLRGYVGAPTARGATRVVELAGRAA